MVETSKQANQQTLQLRLKISMPIKFNVPGSIIVSIRYVIIIKIPFFFRFFPPQSFSYNNVCFDIQNVISQPIIQLHLKCCIYDKIEFPFFSEEVKFSFTFHTIIEGGGDLNIL